MSGGEMSDIDSWWTGMESDRRQTHNDQEKKSQKWETEEKTAAVSISISVLLYV